MRTLFIPYFKEITLANADNLLEKLEPQKIDNEPWPLPGKNPKVNFVAVYNDDALFLKYTVDEKYALAKYTQINDEVWQESCVEFFIRFDNDEAHYNFEFNCLGTPLVGYGFGRDRTRFSPQIISKIETKLHRIEAKEADELTHWTLTIRIPFTLFAKHNINSLKGIKAKGNFYKCGDELPEPKYLCWNNIELEKPNFHVPEFFGELVFE